MKISKSDILMIVIIILGFSSLVYLISTYTPKDPVCLQYHKIKKVIPATREWLNGTVEVEYTDGTFDTLSDISSPSCIKWSK